MITLGSGDLVISLAMLQLDANLVGQDPDLVLVIFVSGTERTLFRTYGGFNTISDHEVIRR